MMCVSRGIGKKRRNKLEEFGGRQICAGKETNRLRVENNQNGTRGAALLYYVRWSKVWVYTFGKLDAQNERLEASAKMDL